MPMGRVVGRSDAGNTDREGKLSQVQRITV